MVVEPKTVSRIVRQIMLPRTSLVALELNLSWQEVWEKASELSWSNLPVYQGNLNNIVGFVRVQDFLRTRPAGGDFHLKNYLRPPLFILELQNLFSAWQVLRQAGQSQAIVVDEFGAVVGLITLEQILAALAGQEKLEELAQPVQESIYLVDGGWPLERVEKILNVCLPREGYATIGGFVFGLFGRLPQPGEWRQVGDLIFRVEQLKGRRIARLHIKRLAQADASDKSHDEE